MSSAHQFVTAAYKVDVEKQSEFIKELKKTEDCLRKEGLITANKAYRMASLVDPSLILEIFEWVSVDSFDKAQRNPSVLARWGVLESLWMDGGFGVSMFPESKMHWAQFKSIT